jgi:multiple sugar transport system permease protein
VINSKGIRASTAPRKTPFLVKLVGAESRYQAKYALWGYLFCLPWIIGLLVFTIGPIIVSFYLSFTQYDVLSAPEFIGLQNYHQALFVDELFWSSLERTLIYSVFVVPLGLLGSLLLAMLLNRQSKSVGIFRAFFFLPSLTPTVALALLWIWLFDPNYGLINQVLEGIGLPGPGWFASAAWALPSIVITSLWAGWGGSTMLIFLAGLQGVERSLLEAADIDGAGSLRKFWNVTLPMISPTMFFNFILGIIAAMQVFTVAYVATEGGPRYATWFLALHIFNQAFSYFQMGYASALAWLFLVVLLIFTVIQLRASRSWVFYGGESK